MQEVVNIPTPQQASDAIAIWCAHMDHDDALWIEGKFAELAVKPHSTPIVLDVTLASPTARGIAKAAIELKGWTVDFEKLSNDDGTVHTYFLISPKKNG